jgi:carboxylesterase
MNFEESAKPLSHQSSSEVGVLVIHGITSTPGSMSYICESLIEAGYNVECPLLPGHGTRWEDMEGVYWWEWVMAMERSLAVLSRRCSKVFVCGLSLGGGIGLYMAAHHPELRGIFLFNHLCVMKKTLLVHLAPYIRHLVRSVDNISGDIKDPVPVEPAYPRLSSFAGCQTIDFTEHIQRKLKLVTVPLLVFKSREDHVIPFESATRTFEGVSSKDKELVCLDNSYHVVTMDHDKVAMMKKSLEFIARLS